MARRQYEIREKDVERFEDRLRVAADGENIIYVRELTEDLYVFYRTLLIVHDTMSDKNVIIMHGKTEDTDTADLELEKIASEAGVKLEKN